MMRLPPRFTYRKLVRASRMAEQRGARLMGLDGRSFLQRNDSHHFLRAVDDLLITGPTLTNVMDLQITLLG